MVCAAYLMGHIDGIDGDTVALAPKAMDTLQREPYFAPFFPRLRDELRAMHGTYGEWKNLGAYEPLKQPADELFKLVGIDIRPRADEGHTCTYRSVQRRCRRWESRKRSSQRGTGAGRHAPALTQMDAVSGTRKGEQ
jgi:hypothetical protein